MATSYGEFNYSNRQLAEGIANAMRAGDTKAAETLRGMLRQQIGAQDKAEYDPTSGMSDGEKRWANIGAGVMDMVEGTKQLFGATSSEDIREKKRRDLQLAGSLPHGKAWQVGGMALAGAPTMFVPGANSVAGAALTGGVMGLLSPTESDNVIAGKAMNTALGAGTGALAQKFLPGVIQKTGSAISNSAGRARDAMVESGLTPEFMRRSLAERTFLQSLGTAPGNARRAITSHRDVPGTQPTPAQQINTPETLGIERRLRESGGEAATELARLRTTSNEARYKFLHDELAQDPNKLWDAASKFAKDAKGKFKLASPIDPNRSLVGEVGRLRNESTNKSYKAFWQNIQDELRTIRALPPSKQVQAYHRFRMDTLDRELKSLGGPGRSDISADNVLKEEVMSIKGLLDRKLDQALAGNDQWSAFLQGYAPKAQAARQAERGVEVLTKIDNLTPASTGTPALTSGRQVIRNNVDKLDDWGNPALNDTANDSLRAVDASLDTEMRPFAPNVRNINSATGANLSRATPAQLALRRLGPVMGGPTKEPVPVLGPSVVTGTAVGQLAPEGASAYAGPKVAATIAGVNMARNALTNVEQRAAYDIAGKLFRMYSDPQEALRVLNAAVQSRQIPAKVAAAVAQELQRVGKPMVGGTFGGAAAGLGAPVAGSMIPAGQ